MGEILPKKCEGRELTKDQLASDEVYKSLSVNLCSNLPGQVMVDLMVNEPKEGDPSYPLYREEFDGIFEARFLTEI